jgi:SAM-dependent methyltransferase
MGEDDMSEQPTTWDARYAGEAYLFGESPNAFLASQAGRLRRGWRALALADGEGRNGVWLAEQGLEVLSVDSSRVAQAKAARLAERRGVQPQFVLADLATWEPAAEAFDVVAAIFIQFAAPPLRDRLFEAAKRSLKPGGFMLLEGYRPEQLGYRTGGPPTEANLYTEPMLRAAFSEFEILELRTYDAVIAEGAAHNGLSAVIDLVARKPVAD